MTAARTSRLPENDSRLEASRTSAERLRLVDISKSYPGVLALDEVSLTLRAGEIHALLGENGAGKSTLIKAIAGAHRAHRGSILLDGREIEIHNPLEAIRLGISVVYQERNLVPTFTAGENVLLDRVVTHSMRMINRRQICMEAEPYMRMVGLDISPERSVRLLSPAEQQLVEIARALSMNARVLLLDEPTASISQEDATRLLKTLIELREHGVAILYVSHKLEEITEIGDVVTVLRDGRAAGPTLPVADVDRDQLIKLMIGRSHRGDSLPRRRIADREPVLEVEGQPTAASADGASFVLHRGEILGWYGLVGAGRTELARAIIGADRTVRGTIRVAGVESRIKSPADALHRLRIGYITEDRQGEGLFLSQSVRRNVAATTWERMRSKLGLLDTSGERRLARDFISKLAIKTRSDKVAVEKLSGGNRQKVSLAKWLAARPDILLVDEPTVGIDVDAKYEIHRIIFELAEQGVSIVLISSDMPEMLRLADRILVFRKGRIVGNLENTKQHDPMSRAIGAALLRN